MDVTEEFVCHECGHGFPLAQVAIEGPLAEPERVVCGGCVEVGGRLIS